MNSTELEYLKELKTDMSEGIMIEHNTVDHYKIRLINKGEELFYHDLQTNTAFICAIQIRNGSIFEKTIHKWDTGALIENKQEILKQIERYFIIFQKIDPTIR
ncbi:hypothetical protein [Pedobacter metabolipauper]|uniref:Uncharacterized protein n=1 Tax=Pedobacter metabolipauper TaxID=425513 RepID=A0A4R6T266_9SPHI|nr:hypothetical protein [Pedobacter metabolipauper]TDQ11788.1 hypothetical protein ATK78_0916 [Pedobacter metabolipauper]